MSSSYGKLFRIQTFGESHGEACGVVIDGCPAGLEIDLAGIQKELDRRKPGQSKITTARNEQDVLEVLSGIFEGKTTGTPICILVRNKDAQSKDYDHLKNVYRPSHADYTYEKKYGIRDHRGGGRSSARETVARVLAGALAQQLLSSRTDIQINSYVSKVGKIEVLKSYQELDLSKIDSNIVRCPDSNVADQMIAAIEEVRNEGNSLGGVVTGVIRGVPVGLGEPVFDKLHAELGKAMLSINAVKGFEIGSGFQGTEMKGSEHNDAFVNKEGVHTDTNHSGGVQGGISNGEDIVFRVAFKPTATILSQQKTLDKQGNEVMLEAKGRHDPCVLPRAVPIVDAMAALVMTDFFLRNKIARV